MEPTARLPIAPADPVVDRRGRPLRELRVSVTDRCNFRCGYCMPRAAFPAGHRFLPRREILDFEEIARVVGVLAGLGVEKVRLTGGEPLLRAELPELVRLLAAAGPVDLALTTNGTRLVALAAPLRDAGLRRITVSLDSVDPATFQAMTDTDVDPGLILAGIDAAVRSGLSPVKVNAVVRRGVNDAGVVDLARRFHGTGVVVRFIEYMDVGTTNGWSAAEVVPAREIVERVDRVLPLEPLPARRGDVARRYRYRDGGGEIGVVASVTEPFCGGCGRARLSADGHLYTCLFATAGEDLRPLLRGGATDGEIGARLASLWTAREDRYSELRAEAKPRRRIEMSYIGG